MSGSHTQPPWEEVLKAEVLADPRMRAYIEHGHTSGNGEDSGGKEELRLNGSTVVRVSARPETAPRTTTTDGNGNGRTSNGSGSPATELPPAAPEPAAEAAPEPVVPRAEVSPIGPLPVQLPKPVVDPLKLPGVRVYNQYPYRDDEPAQRYEATPPVVRGAHNVFTLPGRALYRLLAPEHGDPSPLLFFPWGTIGALAGVAAFVVLLSLLFRTYGDELSALLRSLEREPRPVPAASAEAAPEAPAP